MGGCGVMGLLFLVAHSRLLPPPPDPCLPHTQPIASQGLMCDHEIDIHGYKSLKGIMMQIICVLLGYPAKQG